MGMVKDARITEQVDYYRQRAAEYDETAYGQAGELEPLTSEVVDRLHLAGRVPEIACGTGVWRVQPARWVTDLTAIGTFPEMVELTKARVRDHRVRFVVADASSLPSGYHTFLPTDLRSSSSR